MILRCELCGRKVGGQLSGTFIGKAVCKICWRSLSKLEEVSHLMFCLDEDNSDNQIQESHSIAKAILSNPSVQSPKQSSPIQNKNSATKLNRRTNREKIEYQKLINAKNPINSPPKKAPKEVKPIQCPRVVQDIINFWKALELRNAAVNTVTYIEGIRNTKKALRGTLPCLEGIKYTEKQIRTSITHFYLAATDLNYHPTAGEYKKSLSNTYFANFIYNRYTQKSYMVEYLKKPKLVEDAEIPEDEYPNITKYFANFYVREVLGGIKPKNGIGRADMAHFMKAAEKTADFYKMHKSKMELEGAGIHTMLQFAELVTEALEQSVSGDLHKLTPGWFSSDAMFDKRLPSFLYRQSLIEDRRDL